ncbi:MAG: glycoside hydrolase family 127 protein [Oscillospiraceae bacterium]|nr:glycoside hydrolase family 127 protein [Oscillospiraceae bacterium]MDY2847684.1 glycoside hydrolase family 127 protein [Oscillospiraceae bacterium]
MKIQTQIPVTAYKAEGFIGKYQQLVRDTVIPYQHSVLWDKAPDTEKSHVAANFINAGKALRGEDTGDGFYGMVFQDSDAAKWLEAAAYALAAKPDEALEKQADELINLIAAAQDKDGYLNTYYTIKDKDKRWTNLLEGHELYCSGHMIEAACAYYEATGKRTLLDVASKNAECIYDRFVTQNVRGCPGHPEIELALLKLYRLTGNEHFLTLCKRFIDERGTDPSFFADEAEKRDWTVWGSDPRDNDYRQSGKPVRQQSEATGHAVRAVYLYTGMADLASETGDSELLEACRRLWDNIVHRKMYITGGIGSTVLGEAFTVDYDLPSDTAYAETCASIGLIFFAGRMLENEVKGEYGDIMELAFYNTVLAGMQLDGKRFFYVNPLEIDPGISGVARTHTHDLPVRPKWYACACCPPNAARLIGSIGMYAYGESADTAYCHMFASGSVRFANGMALECTTDYPYDMTVKYNVTGSGRLAVRIPAWSRSYRMTVNGAELSQAPENGYVYIDITDNADIEFVFDGTPSFVRASCRVPRLAGMTALMRGPLVYCFEGADNGKVSELRIDRGCTPEVCGYDSELLGGTVKLKAKAKRITDCGSLYTSEPEQSTPCEAIAVPYYTWGNRGENEMRVWMNV